ncbi:MAG: hypothetical protein KDK55_05610 [Chlamydiia bacterium]|nr:hypothetical protein [Chlamydiia bacterium]
MGPINRTPSVGQSSKRNDCFQSNSCTAQKVMCVAAIVFVFFVFTTTTTVLALYLSFASKFLITAYAVGITLSAVVFIFASLKKYECPSKKTIRTIGLENFDSKNPFVEPFPT